MLVKSFLLITVLAGAVVGSSLAYFSDTETSANNQIVAGSIDLLVNGVNNPPSVVNLDDLKPGDIRTVNKTLQVSSTSNPANVYLHIKDLDSDQGTSTDSETEEEINQWGGPKDDLQNYINYSLQVEGTPIIATASATLLAQASSCYIPLGIVNHGEIVEMQQIFSLPSSVTNWAQGDTLTFSEDFFAHQTRNNPIDPVTGSGRLWNPTIQKCETCTFATSVWASEASDYIKRLRRDGEAVLVARTNTANALGANDTNDPPTNNKFLSLGFGGSVILRLPQVIYETTGDELAIYEVTGGRSSYPQEQAKLEVSQDGTNWAGNYTLSSTAVNGINYVDTSSSGLSQFQYVRITDTSNSTNFPRPQYDSADGFDIDAVQGLHAKSCTPDLLPN